MSKQEEIIEVCGKKVVVRYAKDGAPCEKCVLNGIRGCGTSKCSRLDKVGMEIDERAYFVEAPQEKDYKKLYEELVNSEWYKKYYQGASVWASVAVEQPEEEAPARPANPLIPDQCLTIDGKRYVKRYFRIGDACRRCAFKVGEDANGHAFCKDHGKPEKPCTPDREKGVLVYFIAADADVNKWAVTNAFLHCDKAGKIVSEMYGDKLNNPRNRDKYLAFLQQVNLDDRFGELAEILQRYGAMPASKEQPEADLEAEAERFFKKFPMRANTPGVPDEYLDFETYMLIARHFAEWGAEHSKR